MNRSCISFRSDCETQDAASVGLMTCLTWDQEGCWVKIWQWGIACSTHASVAFSNIFIETATIRVLRITWRTYSRSKGWPKIPSLLWNLNVSYRFCKRSPLMSHESAESNPRLMFCTANKNVRPCRGPEPVSSSFHPVSHISALMLHSHLFLVFQVGYFFLYKKSRVSIEDCKRLLIDFYLKLLSSGISRHED